MRFIDFHAHLMPTEVALEKFLANQRENEIEKTVVVAGGVATRHELAAQMVSLQEKHFSVPNLAVLKLSQTAPERILPFFFANPHVAPDEYQAYGEKFYGLKLGPVVHGVPLNDKRIERYLALAETFGHPVYLHCLAVPGFTVTALVELVAKHPRLSFVLGHAGIGHCDFIGVDLIKPHSTIYFETSGGFSSIVQYAVQQLGIERILFGSEYPLQDPHIERLKLQRLVIDFTLLNANARRLLPRGTHV